MSKKKSLGHNPLAYSMLGHASFDFISPQETEEEKNLEKREEKESKTTKVTVSYYLEEPLVDQIKNLAAKNNTTYSAMISRMLKDSINRDSEE